MKADAKVTTAGKAASCSITGGECKSLTEGALYSVLERRPRSTPLTLFYDGYSSFSIRALMFRIHGRVEAGVPQDYT
jgi:hypothetical protein